MREQYYTNSLAPASLYSFYWCSCLPGLNQSCAFQSAAAGSPATSATYALTPLIFESVIAASYLQPTPLCRGHLREVSVRLADKACISLPVVVRLIPS
jgi:hypothetical protein